MYNKMSLKDVDLKGEKVLCRVDFNVPMDGEGHITDDSRIVASLQTIRYILDQGGKLILVSHLGRPKGEPNPKYSLAPVAPHLSKLLGREVKFAPDCIGPEVKGMVDSLKEGEVILLENVRFHAEEEKNDHVFSRQLASLADVYVNDAFGTAHRAHSSTEGVAQMLNPAVAGFLMDEEIRYLGNALAQPARPFVAVLGGAKAKDKIPVIRNLLTKVNVLLIGGGMAYTFLKAQGLEVGKSLVQEDQLELSRELLKEAHNKGSSSFFPRITWLRRSWKTELNTRSAETTISRPNGWAWISDRKPSSDFQRSSLQPEQSSGTGPWEFSKWTISRQGHWPLPAPLPTPGRYPLSVGGTPWQPLESPVFRVR